jgi:hypothetical protein
VPNTSPYTFLATNVFGVDGHANTIGQKKVLTYFKGPGQFSRSVVDGHGNTIGQKKILTYFRGPGQFSRSVLRLPFSGYVHLTPLSVLTAL